MLAAVAILTATAVLFSVWQYRSLHANPPQPPSALETPIPYRLGDLLFGEKWALFIGLSICVPFGLGTGWWISRLITRPLAAMAEVAVRVEQGDFSVRASAGMAHGEMVDMVNNFNCMIDALDRLEHERRATAASISHELRTPITVLQTHLHAICDGVIAADRAECATLLRQVEHLGRLVDDLHTLSMADAGQLSLQKRRVDMAALVGDIVGHYRPQLAAHGMALELDLPVVDEDAVDPDWTDIRADPDRMRQIVSNLVSNAVHYASQGGWLGVQLLREPAEAGVSVVLRISDAGPGLPAQLQQFPFQRFAQAPGKRRSQSSGLGLSIVNALTTSQGGDVEVGTSVRGGACITLRFPAA